MKQIKEKGAILARSEFIKRVHLVYDGLSGLLQCLIFKSIIFFYLTICTIRVAYRHKDLREELLGLLLGVLLLCYTSGRICGAPQITRITTHHRDPWFNPQPNYFLMLHSYEANILEKKKSAADAESHRWWGMKGKCKWGDEEETIQDISEAADTCAAGNRTNTPSLIRSPAQCLVVKTLLSEAACATTVEHSSHPRKGLMHEENLTLP